jgi:hypothetical protein
MDIVSRYATRDDVKLLAHLMELAMLPSQGHCVFDDLAAAINMDRLDFHEAILLAGASNWGQIEDFVVVEVDGTPGGVAAAFLSNLPDIRPITAAQVQSLSTYLGLSPEQSKVLLRAFIKKFGVFGDLPHLRHPADYVLEYAAVLPDYAGLRLSRYAFGVHIKRALELGCKTFGTTALVGNGLSVNAATRLGLSVHSTITAEEVGGGFPGIHRMILDLTDLPEGYVPGEPVEPRRRRQ